LPGIVFSTIRTQYAAISSVRAAMRLTVGYFRSVGGSWDQAAVNAGLAFRRQAMSPRPMKPRSSIAHVEKPPLLFDHLVGAGD
jgi:hypothetical protein